MMEPYGTYGLLAQFGGPGCALGSGKFSASASTWCMSHTPFDTSLHLENWTRMRYNVSTHNESANLQTRNRVSYIIHHNSRLVKPIALN
jgi:hypothetical protein